LRIDADVADLTGFAQPEKLFRKSVGNYYATQQYYHVCVTDFPCAENTNKQEAI
jgi:hypothetical protein